MTVPGDTVSRQAARRRAGRQEIAVVLSAPVSGIGAEALSEGAVREQVEASLGIEQLLDLSSNLNNLTAIRPQFFCRAVSVCL